MFDKFPKSFMKNQTRLNNWNKWIDYRSLDYPPYFKPLPVMTICEARAVVYKLSSSYLELEQTARWIDRWRLGDGHIVVFHIVSLGPSRPCPSYESYITRRRRIERRWGETDAWEGVHSSVTERCVITTVRLLLTASSTLLILPRLVATTPSSITYTGVWVFGVALS